MEIKEFKEAWSFLGLEDTDEETTRAFKDVDVDNSGIVE